MERLPEHTLPPAVRRRDAVPPGCPLTAAEFEVLSMRALGLSYKEIAAARGTSASATRSLCDTGSRRLGVSSGLAAVSYAGQRGWLGWKSSPTPEPESNLSPFMRAYLVELDAWLASGGRDRRARRGMRIALAGALNAGSPAGRRRAA